MDERWREIERLYHAARELDKSARAEFLAKACAGDPALRDEVESLLAQDEDLGSFLQSPPAEIVAKAFGDGPLSDPPSAAIELGTKVAHYRLTGKIGSGGMGEVYCARDTKLQRDVALKILPQAMAHDAERMARFEREAQVLASLNHPNIAAIYGLEESNGVRALVMELVEGETLAERIVGAGLVPAQGRPQGSPLQESLGIAKQIAEALEYAHERGVIHRDLKPANVKITPEGTVKVLDFGLAKVLSGTGVPPVEIHGQARPERSERDAHATTDSMTEPGMIMGTAAYMSPEQAKGQRVDRRCDIWAFGCVLFEMLSGRMAFDGETISDVLAAVLMKEPDWNALPETTPPAIQKLIHRCLVKDAKRRLRDVGDARIEIEEELSALSREVGATLPPHGDASDRQATAVVVASKRYSWLLWTLAGLLVAGFVARIVANRHQPVFQNPLSNARFTPLSDFKGGETNPAISPDGKFVAFISNRSGTFDIWLIQSNGASLANLTQGRTGDVRGPLRAIGFSGDGSEVWSAGTPQRRLMLWPLMGGSPHNFLDAHAAEVVWSPDGERIVYHSWQPGDPTFVADYNGANQRQIVQNEPGLHNHYQVWSKDGRWIYLVRGRPATREMDLWRISPNGEKLEQLTHLDTDIAYPTPINERTVLFVAHNQDGSGPWLWAFDTETRNTYRVSSGLEEYTAVAATADGQRLAASVVNPRANLWSLPITNHFVDEQSVQAFQLPTVRSQSPRFGGKALFYLSSRDGADGLWRYSDGQAQEIWKGSEGALQSPAAVSADGKSVAFALRRNGKQQMRVMAEDGTQLRPLSNEVDVRGAASWSPDGKWIVVAGVGAGGSGLFKLPVDGGPPVRIASGPFLDPVWSPRGDLIVYCGTQVFTAAPLLATRPDGTPVMLPNISVRREGQRARFLPDGTGLVYMFGDTLAGQDFWLLDLRTMRSRRLTRLSSPAVMRAFDISPDGRRIVFDRLQENSDVVLIDLATTQVRP